MHWGIRRYQNADGSYTSAGKARYGIGSSNKGYTGSNKGYTGRKKKSNGHKGTGGKIRTAKSFYEESSKMSHQTANMLRKSASKSRARKQTKLDLSHMSDQELRDRVNRGHLERQYNQLYGDPHTVSGREHVANFLDSLGDTAQVLGSAASLALIIYNLKKMA